MRKPPFGGLNCRQRSGLGWCLAWRLVAVCFAVWLAVWLVDAMQCFDPEEMEVLLFAATQGFKVKSLRREWIKTDTDANHTATQGFCSETLRR
jgi:hypothetical protein